MYRWLKSGTTRGPHASEMPSLGCGTAPGRKDRANRRLYQRTSGPAHRPEPDRADGRDIE